MPKSFGSLLIEVLLGRVVGHFKLAVAEMKTEIPQRETLIMSRTGMKMIYLLGEIRLRVIQ